MQRLLRVHPKYIEEVNWAWKRKSDAYAQDIADELGRALTLVIVNLFLKGEPVNRVNFIEICHFLGVNWREVAGLSLNEKGNTSSLIKVDTSNAIALYDLSEGESEVDQALKELVGTLCEMLRRLTRKAGNLLRADRTSIFLLDRQTKVLGTIIADDGDGGCLLIDIPADRGIASLAATSLEIINVPFDVYDDPRSEEAKNTDKKTGYRTYTILAWPLLNQRKDLIAVVQLLNKLKPDGNPEEELLQRIDTNGFTKEDEAIFAKFAPSILKILERCQFCYQLYIQLRNKTGTDRESVALQHAKLIAELKRREQQLRRSLEKIS
ncbi:MAG TPA: GAF domain-containing protein [Chroococcales cyanobacterium]